jgi:hypothetical protein
MIETADGGLREGEDVGREVSRVLAHQPTEIIRISNLIIQICSDSHLDRLLTIKHFSHDLS